MIQAPRPYIFANLSATELPVCWDCFISDQGMYTVYYITSNGDLLIISGNFNKIGESTLKSLNHGKISHISVAPSTLLFAVLTVAGNLLVYTFEFHLILDIHVTPKVAKDTKMKACLEIYWCGNSTVICLFRDLIVAVPIPKQPKKTVKQAEIQNIVVKGLPNIFREQDGLIMITLNSYSRLYHQNSENKNIFSLGSTCSSAILYNAYEMFITIDTLDNAGDGGCRAWECMESLQNSEVHVLEKAIDECLIAAAQEIDPQLQKMLLKAANFGQSFLRTDSKKNDDSKIAVASVGKSINDISKRLRTINTVKSTAFAIPLTYNMYYTIHV